MPERERAEIAHDEAEVEKLTQEQLRLRQRLQHLMLEIAAVDARKVGRIRKRVERKKSDP